MRKSSAVSEILCVILRSMLTVTLTQKSVQGVRPMDRSKFSASMRNNDNDNKQRGQLLASLSMHCTGLRPKARSIGIGANGVVFESRLRFTCGATELCYRYSHRRICTQISRQAVVACRESRASAPRRKAAALAMSRDGAMLTESLHVRGVRHDCSPHPSYSRMRANATKGRVGVSLRDMSSRRVSISVNSGISTVRDYNHQAHRCLVKLILASSPAPR